LTRATQPRILFDKSNAHSRNMKKPMDAEVELDVAWKMAGILGTMVAFLVGLLQLQQPQQQQEQATKEPATGASNGSSKNQPSDRKPDSPGTYRVAASPSPTSSRWLPDPIDEPSKFAYEQFVALYTPVWMGAFGMVVVFQWYEQFTAFAYLGFTSALAAPLLLQPLVYPSAGSNSPDANRPLWQRYSFKANVWIAVYSFIGNYWYTHYFYSVLQAKYTMPSHRLNNVPIAMYCATHFYFSSYHLFSNLLLRHIEMRYRPSALRTILFVSTIVVFSYLTAFLETLTISSYPYYTFQDRNMAYTIGSAFYGIYFLVSFPAFYFFDRSVDNDKSISKGGGVSAWDAVVQACGYGMLILFLLDFVRLYLDIPLVVGRDPSTLLGAA
jgi:cycloeucalenol cycloisomerase